ncbi:hypothetical protein HPB47_004798 [Ixodes persulcatus]|uniref:Uncharacterized protein n=1 Tax=Ixodes persulcatus TaxID=34615 RepID=A0AC60PEL6_IXOPE|nr:hypothetical protein HPB47_004798 [Ixodes persulcatus]
MLPSRRPSDDPGSERMKLTERRRLVLGDVHISLETRGELLRRIDKIYAQLLALTNGDGDSAKLNGAAAPSAASLSPSPTETATRPSTATPPWFRKVLPPSLVHLRDILTFWRCPGDLACRLGPFQGLGLGASVADVKASRRRAAPHPLLLVPRLHKKAESVEKRHGSNRSARLLLRRRKWTRPEGPACLSAPGLSRSARAEEMLRCAAVPFTTRRPMFQRQCSDPVPNVPVRETLSRASRRAPPATDILQGDCRKARRSRSCPKLDRRTLPERPVKPPPTSMPGKIKPNTTLLLRQQAALERRREEERRRDEEEQRERVRTLRKSRVALQMRALECCLPRPRSSDSIRDRLRAHRMAAMQRLEDYRQELQDIQDRVSSNPLLVERQALYGAQRLLEHQYERKLHELGLDNDFLESKAALHVQRRRSGSLDSRSAASGSSAGSPHHSRRETHAAGFDARPRRASLRSSAASDEQSDTESTRGSHVDLSQASGEGESDRKSAKSASSSSIRTPAST